MSFDFSTQMFEKTCKTDLFTASELNKRSCNLQCVYDSLALQWFAFSVTRRLVQLSRETVALCTRSLRYLADFDGVQGCDVCAMHL